MSFKNEYVGAVGIDIGTFFCCIAVDRGNGVEIVPNENGEILTSSEFKINDMKGEFEADKIDVSNVKRLIGKTSREIETILSPNEDNRDFLIKTPKLAEMNTSRIISGLKSNSEEYLKKNVSKVVCTVPNSWTDSQKVSTKRACENAGLEVLQILSDTSASAISFGCLSEKFSDERNILVVDIGGSSQKNSVVTIDSDGVYEVKSTNGISFLGGIDFDRKLFDFCMKDISQNHGIREEEINKQKVKRRLLRACENVKISLSTKYEETIFLEGLIGEFSYTKKIDRKLLDSLFIDLVKRSIRSIKDVISGFEEKDIHDILLTGQTTQIPILRHAISQELFSGREIKTSSNINLDPRFSVVSGAAILSGVLTATSKHQVLLLDQLPHTLSIETVMGKSQTLIEKHTVIPCKKSWIFTNYSDSAQQPNIRIYEGEDEMSSNNHPLGNFVMSNIRPYPTKQMKIEVCFTVDKNGILDVSAKDINGDLPGGVNIEKEKYGV